MAQRSPIVDVHHHALLPDLTGGIDLGTVDIPPWSIDDSVAFMDKTGIDVAVLSLSSPGIPYADPARARDAARCINETFAAYVARYPSRFAAFATLPLPDIDGSLRELEHALGVLRLDGVGVMSNYGPYFGTPFYDPLLDALNRTAAPVHIHPRPPVLTREQDFGLPPSLYEFTFETTRVAVQVAYNNVFGRFPNLKLILSHAGGTVPFLAKRLTYGPQIVAELKGKAPIDTIAELGKFYFDVAMVSGRFTLPALNALVAPDRILYGSDFPYMPVADILEAKDDVFDFTGYSGEDVRKIASENALRLLPRVARQLNKR
ncbi:amidohydrolase [Aliidongia dinghuensis]|uniref:Amidohydrolase n=1 Tax=Aliidongia dinghuensis TaxID=1867774 RepID=A0A8J3E1U2_9PROT|nr:amidohydrolase family protein [Aliidongia dinghuensis]GGF04330.1 amidohydrolase [Aliidongia dinghuensis]